MLHPLLKKLSGGDRRSISRANSVSRDVLARPALFRILVDGLTADDPVVRMRSADALEKVTLQRPELLRPHKRRLLEIAGQTRQQEVRWHMALVFPRMNLPPAERAVALDILLDYLRDKSSIVKTWSMQCLADFVQEDPGLKRRLLPLLRELAESGTPAMCARGRKLLAGLEGPRSRK
jgi:hypothetical protein